MADDRGIKECLRDSTTKFSDKDLAIYSPVWSYDKIIFPVNEAIA